MPNGRTLQQFQNEVLAHFRKHRRDLPWRKTHDPYKILVSEIMLQQTQVDRVLPKYKEFLNKFPSVDALAKASLGDVLRAWSGLGYNRRAKMLHECAKAVVRDRKGIFPKDEEKLRELPGIGPYTAGAVMAFAYNKPAVIVETNIRTVFLHHFFPKKKKVEDKVILALVEKTLPKDTRKWYSALMDYGAHIKKVHGNPNVRSKHYVRQSVFKGSARELRGRILRTLGQGPQTLAMLGIYTGREADDVRRQLYALAHEGMVVKRGSQWHVP